MPKKILIIEDEKFLADMYKWKLEKEGYRVECAQDGQTGIDLSINMKPDLILLDIVMPLMDGYKTLRVLRQLPDTSDIPIFIFSNLGQQEEIDKGLAEGANGYLVKAAMTPTQLVEKIGEALKHERKAEEPGQKVGKKDLTNECKSDKGRQVLIIEDQEDIARMYELRFKKEGYRVVSAGNGAWGLKLAHREKFDVIILDIVMPALHGLEALKEIRSSSVNHDCLVIILSNSGQERDVAEAKALGANHYFIKSQLTPVKLVETVDSLLVKREKRLE